MLQIYDFFPNTYYLVVKSVFNIMKRKIRLSEARLRNIIKETVDEVASKYELESQFRRDFMAFRDKMEAAANSERGIYRMIIKKVSKCRVVKETELVFNMLVKRHVYNTAIVDLMNKLLGDMGAFVRAIDCGNSEEGFMNIAIAFDPQEMAETRLIQFKKHWIDDPRSYNAKYAAPGHTVEGLSEAIVRRVVKQVIRETEEKGYRLWLDGGWPGETAETAIKRLKNNPTLGITMQDIENGEVQWESNPSNMPNAELITSNGMWEVWDIDGYIAYVLTEKFVEKHCKDIAGCDF